ncbi:ATP-dependent nuclease [Acinetobacter modestus]|uniref:ATP-dependent nuclease n=1 Tax=Acinetobacter modestus TaxID=1776740 RepID=UPI001F4A4FE4|nr:AAA family ATPase [Acinetobacter modestus]MCH7333675.1 AAA family ATPase [Acinetobacter modestus]
MFISKIEIENFRNFKHQEIIFNEGVNVIIGHNNAGKTNLLTALSLVIDPDKNKRLDVDDFTKNIEFSTLKVLPPKISIQVTLKKGSDTLPDDLAMVANWLTKLESDFEAKLTYEFFLPEKEVPKYISAMSEINEADENCRNLAWKIIKNDFIRLYSYKIYGGEIANHTVADGESISKFDFQFLDAIRDVERDMLTGKNTLLKNVFDFFMDYDIKGDSSKLEENKIIEIKARKKEFLTQIEPVIESIHERMKLGKEQILSYAEGTGASFNKAVPNFEGNISDIEMFSFLRLIIEYETGIKIPATHNGLGYNNLIFMSLLLAKMQVNADGKYMGDNAKVFSTLVIEEPEAHLHPAMQYKFLQFLKKNKKEGKVRQIFVTSHSTHITSAVSLSEIICLYKEADETKISYPDMIFPSDGKSKRYVQRFLDATKSDILFSQKILFVEGIAEQLLMSIFARYLGKSLEDHHVAVVNVGGRYFTHFLHLFDSNNSNTIFKKVACITDIDPERKKIKPTAPTADDSLSDEKLNYQKCYPFEFELNPLEFEYKQNICPSAYNAHPNISFFSPDNILGKTLEYEILRANPTAEFLVTDFMSNQKEIKSLMVAHKENKTLDQIIALLKDKNDENKRIIASIRANTKPEWTNDNKIQAIIASRYLNSVGKGENALELARLLEENLEKKGTDDFRDFIVPTYIEEAIEFLCQ